MGMNCEKTREALSLYIDCKLDDPLMQQVTNHLETCTACHDEFEHISETVTILKELPEMPLPEGFNKRLHQALTNESKWVKSNHQPGYIPVQKGGRRSISFNWKQISAASAVLVVLAASAGLYNQGFFSYIYDAMYSTDASYEQITNESGESDESDSVDLFLEVSPKDVQDQQKMAMSLNDEDENGYGQAPGTTHNENSPDAAGNDAQKNQPQQYSEPPVTDPYTAGQGDRGVLSQRQFPETENPESDDTASSVAASVNRLAVETKLQDTFSLHYVDVGTLQYSLKEYKKTDENIEIFVYNIQGSKDGLPVNTQITIRADADGLSMLP